MEKKTFKDLKNFLDTLTDEQLNQELVIEIVDRSVERNIGFGALAKDVYMYDDDVEDTGTLQQLKQCHEEDDDFDETKLSLLHNKGEVFICVE